MPRILLSLVDNDHQIISDLTEQELTAIGAITVGWAYLEHELFIITSALADARKLPLPEDAKHSSFKRRVNALKNFVKANCAPSPKASQLLELLTTARNLERSRHRITHGLWDWTPSDPEGLRASSFRPTYDFDEPFDLDKLIKLVERIGALNFRLTYPEGKKAAVREMLEGGPFVAREFLLGLGGRRGESRRRPRPKRPTRKQPHPKAAD